MYKLGGGYLFDLGQGHGALDVFLQASSIIAYSDNNNDTDVLHHTIAYNMGEFGLTYDLP